MFRIATLALLAAVFTLGLAEAATVSYSGSVEDVTVIYPSGVAEVVVKQFDNGVAGPNGDQLGATLNSVTLVLSGSQYAELLLTNAQGENEMWTLALSFGSIVFGDGTLDGDMNVSQEVSYSANVEVNDGPSAMTFIPGTMTGIGSGVETFTSGLDAFNGNGTLIQNVYFSGGWSAQGMTGLDSFGVPVYTGAADWSVVYDYTPVPEPSVFGLLAIGGAGMALRRRWRRRVGG
jgi:hypothetical protein